MPSNFTITPDQYARDLGVIFASTLSMSDHISSVSTSCFLFFRDLQRIRNTRLFHCSHHRNLSHLPQTSLLQLPLSQLPHSQLGRLQFILNFKTFLSSGCLYNSQIRSHHSIYQISSLAQNGSAHSI